MRVLDIWLGTLTCDHYTNPNSTVVICDGRGVLLPSKGRNREE